MPDSPDFSKYLPGSNRFSLQDMGELAARLGSPCRFDRRGEVVWFDTCEFGMSPWAAGLSGAAASVRPHTYAASVSGYSIRLTPGSTVNYYAGISHYLTPETVTRIGVEATVAFTGVFPKFEINAHWNGQVYLDLATCIINATDGTLDIINDAGAQVAIATIPISFWAGTLHHTVKMVADYQTGYYARLLYDDLDFDVSTHKLYRRPVLNVQGLEINLQHYGSATFQHPCYIGHTIVTTNEP